MDLKKDSDDTLTMGAKTALESALNHYKENFTLSQKIDNAVGLIEAPKGMALCQMEFRQFTDAVDNFKSSA